MQQPPFIRRPLFWLLICVVIIGFAGVVVWQRPNQVALHLDVPTTTPYATGGSATLGGTIDGVIARYGHYSTLSTSTLGIQSGCMANVAHWCTYVVFALAKDNALHISYVTASAPDGKLWTLTDARTACMPWLPGDKRLQESLTKIDGDHQVTVERYLSQMLASRFAASFFVDEKDGRQLPLGTLTISYIASDNNPDQITRCIVRMGGNPPDDD